MPKSKWFRVATEGATTDGRAIQRSWIEQAAKNFNRAKYGARVWVEHMRSLLPEGPFAAHGDVLAVKAETVEDGKLALFAQIEPLDNLLAMNKKGQKLYTSVEIDPNFADTGEAYLVGLAVTDTPASLGTELLTFAAQAKDNPLAGRKTSPGTVFTEALAFSLELESDPAAPEQAGVLAKALEKFTAVMEKFTPKPELKPETPPPATIQSTDVAALAAAMQGFASTTASAMEKISQQLTEQKKAHDELVTKLNQQPADPARPAATGGDGYAQAEY